MRARKKLYIVTDLGPGDGGKGGVVHKISHLQKAHTIIKVGGAQGSHGVVTSNGDRFAFSQFGCGTFEGVRTHLSGRFVVSPDGLLDEAKSLRYDCGIYDVMDMLSVDRDALCATPYHGIASRLKEMALAGNPRGTIGTGVGEAYRDSLRYPELAIHARDLPKLNLRNSIEAVRAQIRYDLAPLINGEFLPEDRLTVEQEIQLLDHPGFLEDVTGLFRKFAQKVNIVGPEVLSTILARDGVVVVESSHGVLTDHYRGFHPHTSAIRTLPCFARAMIDDAGYDGHIVSIGVTRAYQIRHGAGPMPTADEAMAERLLPGSHKEENRFQGKVRVGPLDLVMLRYAIACSGGPQELDALAVTWFDQIHTNGVWQVCDSYRNATDPAHFTPSGEIKVRTGDDAAQLVHQEKLGQKLLDCVPELTELEIGPETSRAAQYDICSGLLQEELGIPVRMVSFGPTERDKMCT